MTITTFSSDRARFSNLYKHVMRRNLGYFVLMSIFIFLFYPIQYMMEAFRNLSPGDPYLNTVLPGEMGRYQFVGLGANYTPASAVFFSLLMLLAPVVLALMFSSYMQSKKAVDVFHALPVRRETLLTVHGLAALTMLGVPVVLSNLVIGLVSVTRFGFHGYLLGRQALDMVGWLICGALIYTVVMFVSVQMGTTFDSLMFSGFVLVALPGVVGTVMLFLSNFLYGFSVSEEILRWLVLFSPVLYPVDQFNQKIFSSAAGLKADGEAAQLLARSQGAMVVYLLITVALFYLTLKLYTRRSSERAETTSSKGTLSTVCELIITFMGGIFGGTLFHALTDEGAESSFYIWSIISGFLVYAILEAILNRGFKSLKKRLPVGAAMVGATTIFAVLAMNGGLGYENRVPDLDKISSVELRNYDGTVLQGEEIGRITMAVISDTQVLSENNEQMELLPTGYATTYTGMEGIPLSGERSIQAVRSFHQMAVENRFYENGKYIEKEEPHVWLGTILLYHMKDGSTVTRKYNTVSMETAMQLLALETEQEWLEKTHPFYNIAPTDIEVWTLFSPQGELWGKGVPYPSQSENEQLLQAVQQELSTGMAEAFRQSHIAPVAYLRFESVAPRSAKGSLYTRQGTYPVYGDPTSPVYALLAGGRNLGGLPSLEQVSQGDPMERCKGAVVSYESPTSGWNSVLYKGMERRQSTAAVESYLLGEGLTGSEEKAYYEEQYYDGSYINGNPAQQHRIQNKEELDALAKAVRASVPMGQGAVKINFLFEGSTDSWTVAASIKALPEELQQLLMQPIDQSER